MNILYEINMVYFKCFTTLENYNNFIVVNKEELEWMKK